MPWLLPVPIAEDAEAAFSDFLTDLDAKLRDPATDRNALTRELLAHSLYGRPYDQLRADAPIAALNLDPRHITLEAEYYAVTDQERFGQVKPLLWLWKNMDLSPAGQSATFGIELRRVLAAHVFKRVGRNFKCWQNVEFSVGYNLEVGDDVVIHRYAFIDDIGGVELRDGASVSDYVNIYSHTHSVINGPDVTLRRTVIGRGARLTYHATILAGSVVSDDAMIATGALVRGGVPPHGIAMGVPARVTRFKARGPFERYDVDSRRERPEAPRKANTDYPDPTPNQTRLPDANARPEESPHG